MVAIKIIIMFYYAIKLTVTNKTMASLKKRVTIRESEKKRMKQSEILPILLMTDSCLEYKDPFYKKLLRLSVKKNHSKNNILH